MGGSLEAAKREPHTLTCSVSSAKHHIRLFLLLYGYGHEAESQYASQKLQRFREEKPELFTSCILLGWRGSLRFEYRGIAREGVRTLTHIPLTGETAMPSSRSL